MKLKTKLISIIAPTALITTVAPIALTGCGTTNYATTITYNGDKNITTLSTDYSMEFTLDKPLSSDWNLTCGLNGDIQGTMYAGPKSTGWTIDGTKVTIPCHVWKMVWHPTSGDYAIYGLKFTCYDSLLNELWKVNIDGFKVTYI